MTKKNPFKNESQDARRHDQQKEVHPKNKKSERHLPEKNAHSGLDKHK